MSDDLRAAAAAMGRKGGAVKGGRKSAASRENARKATEAIRGLPPVGKGCRRVRSASSPAAE